MCRSSFLVNLHATLLTDELLHRILLFFEIQIQYFHVVIKNPFPMTKSTFKGISILEVLNWVTVHSQTEKYVEIISTPRDW